MRRIAAFVFAVLLAMPALSNAGAQDAYPTRPITIISPYATKAKPRDWPSFGSMVHWRVSGLPDGSTTFSPSLNARKMTMPR